MKRAATKLAWGGLAVAFLATATAAAQPKAVPSDEERRARARNYFDAGAQAYASGAYDAAAEAFLQAHALVPKPALLFSAAQAYRRQQLLQPKPSTLRRTIALYRRYLGSEGPIHRRDDAMRGLEAMVVQEARRPPPPPEGTAPPDPPPPVTRLLLTSAADEARISVDDGPPMRAPVIMTTRPGPHRVRVEAPRHATREITVVAIEGALVPQAIALSPRPARLAVGGSPGDLYVDGTLVAEAPGVVSVAPGARAISVVRAGYAPYATTATLLRGEAYDLQVDLAATPQRWSAWGLFGGGAAAVVVGGGLLTYGLVRQSDAIALRDARVEGNTSPEDLARYRDAVADRDAFTAAAGVTGGLGAAALVVGGLVYALEPTPRVLPPDATEPPPDEGVDFTVGLGALRIRAVF
ncbi:MAG: PEGA domain-containing protein [Myxococcota bacterium]